MEPPLEEQDQPRRAANPDQDDAAYLTYDYLKHLTSLSILVLGGVLIVAKDLDPSDVKPASILVALALIGGGGVCSFSGSSEIVRAKSSRTEPGKFLSFWVKAAPVLLAVGTGYFLAIFADSLT